MENRTLPHNHKAHLLHGELRDSVEQISKENKDTPTTQKKDMPPQNAKPNTAQFMPFKQPLNQHKLHTAQREKKKGNEQAMYA